MRFSIFITSFLLLSFNVHKFYVSVSQVDFNQEKKRLEITNRIFIDDFSASLNASISNKIELEDMKINAESVKILENYINKNLQFTLNKKIKELQIKSFEIEGDVFVIYSIIANISNIQTIEIENKLLFDLVPSQQHIVHLNINNTKKSLLMDFNSRKSLLKI